MGLLDSRLVETGKTAAGKGPRRIVFAAAGAFLALVAAAYSAAVVADEAASTAGLAEQVASPADIAGKLASAAGLAAEVASAEARDVARWIGQSADNDGLPFMLVDKVAARVFVFNAAGELLGHDAALLGSARGDGSVAGIGALSLNQIRVEDRTTPAGRFIAHLDKDIHGRGVLLIDYEASIALHPVVPGTAKERRAERLRSETPEDNRISFGCINVPPGFYDTVVRPAFTGTAGVVYILPETRAAAGYFDAGARQDG